MTDNVLTSDISLGFIGAGNMAQSLIGGVLDTGFSAEKISVSDPSPECRSACEKMGVNSCDDNIELIERSQVVILAVKPQIMKLVLEPLSQAVVKNKPMLISIAAGINIDLMDRWLGKGTAIVRCMPNTPSLLREGATALYANDDVSDQQRLQALAILQAVGLALWVNKESELDTVTALSGSGPAYFFLMMELMQQAGEKLGLSTEVSRKLTLQTAFGTAKMAIESDVDVAELRRRVTSPNGTTHAAVQTFLNEGFGELVENALVSAQKRSIELSQELDS